MEVSGHRKKIEADTEIPKLRQSYVIRRHKNNNNFIYTIESVKLRSLVFTITGSDAIRMNKYSNKTSREIKTSIDLLFKH